MMIVLVSLVGLGLIGFGAALDTLTGYVLMLVGLAVIILGVPAAWRECRDRKGPPL